MHTRQFTWTTVCLFMLGISFGIFVFALKHQVQSLETELGSINAEINDNNREISVLKAEWSHLNDPARIRRLSQNIGLRPITPSQIVMASSLSWGGDMKNGNSAMTYHASAGNTVTISRNAATSAMFVYMDDSQ
ncbi:MAG: hypothetical protein GY804_05640 [Alphaproteobacteria bacterium]|nr:hypothetical protein [Alphaproteobacteria bacterium]